MSQKSNQRHKQPEITLKKLRSAITNGRVMFPDVDHRSAWMRRLRDLVSDHISDLGGEDNISSAEMLLVRRGAMLALQLELMERNWAEHNEGEASADALQLYQQVVNTLRRTLESLGLQRRQRDVTPSLASILSERHRNRLSDTEDAEFEEATQ